MPDTPISLRPIVKTVKRPVSIDDYYRALTKGSEYHFLLESKDIVPKYGEHSIGTHAPCLRIVGNGDRFFIEALTPLGSKLLGPIQEELSFVDDIRMDGDSLKGRLVSRSLADHADEMERLTSINHTEILRRIAFMFKPEGKPTIPYGGLFGIFSYDFIDQFETLSPSAEDIIGTPDYVFYFADNLFVVDHKKDEMHIIAASLSGRGIVRSSEECERLFVPYRKALEQGVPSSLKPFPAASSGTDQLRSDTTEDEYIQTVTNMREHVKAGDVFQIVPSRTIIADYDDDPFRTYIRLSRLNPSPYMFFFCNGDHHLIGSSPEMAVRVQGKNGDGRDAEKTAEIRPIAGTRPRGLIDGELNIDLDSRYEAELKIDKKEVAEHMMLVDLARNDLAKVSVPGTTVCDEPLIVEKYSHVQHLVSNVSSKVRKGFDALHVYTAVMNMGTVTGAPKIMAMDLLRRNEKSKRGYYGGAVAYLTPSGDMDSALIIRSVVLRGNRAFIRAGAGVVFDSVPELEYAETAHKAKACLAALGGEER
ncbi:MAG: anthranilate synthase component 1 [archaeon]